jgi:hypothetical protein
VLWQSRKEVIYTNKSTANKLIKLIVIDHTTGYRANNKVEELSNICKDINKSLN